MSNRSAFQPYWRMNKSVLPLGITHDDLLYTLIVFVLAYLFLGDFIATILISSSFLVTNTTMKSVHRKGAFFDYIVQKIKGEKVYVVSKNRGFRSS